MKTEDSRSLLAKIMSAADSSKRRLKALPGHLFDQLSHFRKDIPTLSQFNKALAAPIDKDKLLIAIQQAAESAAVPGGGAAAGIFAGPKGIRRLKQAGETQGMEEFTSRFFGPRAEINPTNADLVIQTMLHGPEAKAVAKLEEKTKWFEELSQLRDDLRAYPDSAGLELDIKKKEAAQPPDLTAPVLVENFP